MTIQSSAFLVDGTITASAGTSTGLVEKSRGVEELVMVLDDGSEFVGQTKIAFSVKDPKISASAPNGYTQARSKVKYTVPLALDNGNTTINSLELSLAVDHETTDAEIQTMLVAAAQLLTDSDYSDFWKKQYLA